jgi:diguanylate cyclase (GGDEF)-like protein
MSAESPIPPTPKALLMESNRAVQSALRKYLEEGGYGVEVCTDVESALAAARKSQPDLVVAGAEAPDRPGETLCERLKAEVSSRLPVILLYEPGDEDAERRSTAAGSDSYLVAPIKKHAVLTAARGMLRIRALLEQIENLERALEQARTAAPGEGEVKGTRPQVAGDPTYDFEFFKKLLLMEVKRSKRYAYPISLAIVAFDGFQEVTADLDAKARGRVVGSLLAQITLCIRDIDLPVLYAEDKVLVFMPHTPRAGALIVGGRLRDRIRDHAVEGDGDDRIRLTVSIGLAAFEGQGTVSFGGLIKDALAALRKVQLAGGDGVEASGEAPKSRVSIG